MKIDESVAEMQKHWKNLTMDSLQEIKSTVKRMAENPEVRDRLRELTRDLPKGVELFRGETDGHVLLAYGEKRETYRDPHDHGNAWVMYSVVEGEMEMGSYFNATQPDGSPHLVLKAREKLAAGDIRIYLPGEIHDTLCLSENAVILRLTSLDLRHEEQAGRMKRYAKEIPC